MSDPDVSLVRRVAVLAASGAVVLGACAQEASDSTLAGDGAEMIDQDSGGDRADVDLVEAVDNTRFAESAAMTITLEVVSPVGGGIVELTGDLSRDDVGTATGAAVSGGEGFELEMLADGDTAWITSDAPEMVDALPEGVRWVEGSVAEMRADRIWTGIDTSFAVLSVLRGVDDVSEAGTTEIGGEDVRLFEGEVDWEAALDRSDPDERAALEETITLTGDPELEVFTVTVGLDGDDRVRMLAVEIVAGPRGGAEDMPLTGDIEMRIDMEIESLDHDVDVPEAPPADETVPIGEVPEVATMLAEGL